MTTASPFAKVERPPVLSLALNNISKLEDASNVTDDLRNLWSVFTKCKGALQDGERLENLSWRLWSRQSHFFSQSDDDMSALSADDADAPEPAAVPVDPREQEQHRDQPLSDPEDQDWESDSSSEEPQNVDSNVHLAPPPSEHQEPSLDQHHPVAIPMGSRSVAPRSAASHTQSSSSAPTRPPLHKTLSFQKRKKNRSGSFQSAKHRSLTPVELQELLSTILPMRITHPPVASSSSSLPTAGAAVTDTTPPAPTPAPLPVVTPPGGAAAEHRKALQCNSSQRDSNSSIETRFSEEGLSRISPASDTSVEGTAAAVTNLDQRTPRPPLHKLPEAEEEDRQTPTKSDVNQPASHHVLTRHTPEPLQPSSSTQSENTDKAAALDTEPHRPERTDGGLKRAHSTTAANHLLHHHHQPPQHSHHHHHHGVKGMAVKRPAIHRKGHSSKLSHNRIPSAKNVRILDDALHELTPAADSDDMQSNGSSSKAVSRTSSDRGKSRSRDRLSARGSSSNALALMGGSHNRSRTSLTNLTKMTASESTQGQKPIPVEGTTAGSSLSIPGAAQPSSSEPRSVVRGFEAPPSLASASPQPPPRVPFCSPALGPPPRVKAASGPPPLPASPNAEKPIMTTPATGLPKRTPQQTPAGSPTKRAPPSTKRKFFLGGASASDSDEMPKSPDHPHPPTFQSLSSRPSLPTHPSSLKNEQHFPEAMQQDEAAAVASTSKAADVADDADDSSGWGSDYTEDDDDAEGDGGNARADRTAAEKALSKSQADAKGKAKAVDHPEPMFLKRVPTAPGQLNRVESRTGLLTQLFKPSAEDVRAVDSMLRQQRSQANLVRNHSAVGLMAGHHSSSDQHHHHHKHGHKGAFSPTGRKLQQSKSAVALPVMSFERGDDFPRIEPQQQQQQQQRQREQQRPQVQIAEPAVRRPSMPTKSTSGHHRLGGKPADVELSDDSDDSDEEGDQVTSLDKKKSPEQEVFTPTKQAAFAAAVARHQAQLQLKEGGGAPEPIPFTPRTTRRSMLSTEMSESLRRNLLWERQSRARLLGLPPAPSPQQQQAAPQRPNLTVGAANSRTTTDLSGIHKAKSQSQIAPKTWQFSGGFHEHGW